MPIIKTLLKATKLEKEKFTIPKSVQDAIPIRRVWPDGIFQAGKQFSKTFSFTDINYSITGKDEKKRRRETCGGTPLRVYRKGEKKEKGMHGQSPGSPGIPPRPMFADMGKGKAIRQENG